jgi:hypothetical protein
MNWYSDWKRRQQIVTAIRNWAGTHGGPPRVSDWRNVTDPDFIAKYGRGWPSYLTVIRYSSEGTWDSAMRDAGFEPRGRGRPRNDGLHAALDVKHTRSDTPDQRPDVSDTESQLFDSHASISIEIEACMRGAS